ncbi:pathogenicity island 1 effector protein SipB [Salmonella enterica subsp. enterica serovar Poona]|nr:pathogenicity island 1 effector protein SipB [Salmonella enterica subsp. enterica serovar Poona]
MSTPIIHDRSIYISNKSSSLASAAFESVRKDGRFMQAADNVLKDLLNVQLTESKTGRSEKTDPSSVPLRAPVMSRQDKLNTEGQLTLLLGRLALLMGETSVSEFASRLETRLAMIESRKKKGEKLSDTFKSVLEQAHSAMDLYEKKMEILEKAKETHSENTANLELAEKKFNNLSPGEPGYDLLQKEVESVRNECSVSKKNLEIALSSANAAHSEARDKTQQLDRITSQMQGTFLTVNQTDKNQTDNLNSISRFTMLLSIFIELVGKNNEESLNNDMALFRALQESRKDEMLRKSEEHQEETRKAEALNRTMGCIGKVVGALITVGSVIAAVFSGGAALGLAAAGLALMLADGIVKAATGTSFIQQALNPVVQYVLKPLMDIIGKAISEVLKGIGVDKNMAEMVGNIMGAIVSAIATVAVVVAVAVFGKSAVSTLGNILNKMFGENIKKLLPDVLKHVIQNSSKILTQGMQRITGRPGGEVIGNALNKTVLGMSSANTAVQSGAGVAEGVFLKKASDAFADFTLARFSGEQLQQWLKQAVELFGNNSKIALELQKTLSSVIQQHSDASRFISRQIRG